MRCFAIVADRAVCLLAMAMAKSRRVAECCMLSTESLSLLSSSSCGGLHLDSQKRYYSGGNAAVGYAREVMHTGRVN